MWCLRSKPASRCRANPPRLRRHADEIGARARPRPPRRSRCGRPRSSGRPRGSARALLGQAPRRASPRSPPARAARLGVDAAVDLALGRRRARRRPARPAAALVQGVGARDDGLGLQRLRAASRRRSRAPACRPRSPRAATWFTTRRPLATRSTATAAAHAQPSTWQRLGCPAARHTPPDERPVARSPPRRRRAASSRVAGEPRRRRRPTRAAARGSEGSLASGRTGRGRGTLASAPRRRQPAPRESARSPPSRREIPQAGLADQREARRER